MKPNNSRIVPRIYTEQHKFCNNNAIDAIMHWESLAETPTEAFNKAMDIYEELCLNSNVSSIRTCGMCLAEGTDKVRDASQLIKSLKYRNSRLKRKIVTKNKNNFDSISDNIQSAIDSIKRTMTSNGVSTSSPSQVQTEAVIEECFNVIIHEAKKNRECDRIISNYNKISTRFNIDKIISEASYDYGGMYIAIMEIAKCIDTYNIPLKNKLSHSLETAYYAINKNNINYQNECIIEAVMDYYILSSGLSEQDIGAVQEVKKDSVLFTDDDFDILDYIIDRDDDNILLSAQETANVLIENYCSPFAINEDGFLKDMKKDAKDKKKEIKKAGRQLIKDAKKGNPDERIDRTTQREISEFRKECIKDPDNKTNVTRLKAMVTGIFTKSPYQIVYDLPSIFIIIRGMVVVLMTYIHPILGLVGFITNSIIKLTLSRKQTEKIIKAYQNEIDAVKDKLEKSKDNQSKENLQKYLDELNKDYAKIKEYENNLYSEDENYERDTSTEYDGSYDDDFDFDDDDWDDFDFEETANIESVANLMQSISEGLIDDNIEGIVFKNIYKLDNDAIDQLTDFSITVPTVLERNKLCDALTEYRNQLRENSNDVSDYIRIDYLNENIYKLKNDRMVYSTSNDLQAIKCYLTCLNEMINMNMNEEYVMEMNFTNTLKLAVDRLKKNAVKLKDKEKQASNAIDMAANNISKGIEAAAMNDNREAIIKGRILPSASKCIKIACVLGVTWAINPAVAVISAVGGFAYSHKLKAKERQLVLDDIEIELKMVERYIRQAEDENDLKKIRQLEIIQRNLERQRQRLKYKMAIYYKQDVPPVGDSDD